MKTNEALGIITALNSITSSGRLVPSKFAYASVINRKRLADFAEAFEAGNKNLLDKYGQKDAAGELIVKDGRIPLTDGPAYQKEYIELGEREVDVKLQALPLAEFPSEVTMTEMDALVPMVAEVPA